MNDQSIINHRKDNIIYNTIGITENINIKSMEVMLSIAKTIQKNQKYQQNYFAGMCAIDTNGCISEIDNKWQKKSSGNLQQLEKVHEQNNDAMNQKRKKIQDDITKKIDEFQKRIEEANENITNIKNDLYLFQHQNIPNYQKFPDYKQYLSVSVDKIRNDINEHRQYIEIFKKRLFQIQSSEENMESHLKLFQKNPAHPSFPYSEVPQPENQPPEQFFMGGDQRISSKTQFFNNDEPCEHSQFREYPIQQMEFRPEACDF